MRISAAAEKTTLSFHPILISTANTTNKEPPANSENPKWWVAQYLEKTSPFFFFSIMVICRLCFNITISLHLLGLPNTLMVICSHAMEWLLVPSLVRQISKGEIWNQLKCWMGNKIKILVGSHREGRFVLCFVGIIYSDINHFLRDYLTFRNEIKLPKVIRAFSPQHLSLGCSGSANFLLSLPFWDLLDFQLHFPLRP